MKYKITIEELTSIEVPETDYKVIGQDEDGKDEYGYVETGKMEIKTNSKEIYKQTIEDLDIGELAIFINRVK